MIGSSGDEAAREQLLATGGVTGVMRVPLPDRFEAIRAKYNEFGFSGPTDSDRERDQVIGFLIDQVVARRDECYVATVRAEEAEAEVKRLKAAAAWERAADPRGFIDPLGMHAENQRLVAENQRLRAAIADEIGAIGQQFEAEQQRQDGEERV